MAQLYVGTSYTGTNTNLPAGDYPSLQASGDYTTVSSIQMPNWYWGIFYGLPQYAGSGIYVGGNENVPDLSIDAQPLQDTIQSARVFYTPPPDAQLAQCCNAETATNCGGYTPGSSLCPAKMQEFCSSNFNSSCKNWCRNPSSKGVCDPIVATYCQNNPSDTYCSCLNSAANNPQYGINPKCVDAQCLQYGYLTQNQTNTACPDIVNCQQQVLLQESGVQLASGLTLQQNCGSASTINNSSSIATPTSGGTTTNSLTLLSANFSWWWLLLIVFLLLGAFWDKISSLLEIGGSKDGGKL